MSRVIVDMKPLLREGLLSFLGLVVPVGVDQVFGEEFAGGPGGDECLGSVQEQEYSGTAVRAADAEVAEPAGVADGDRADVVDGVVADPPVLVAVSESGFGFREGPVCLAGCVPVQGAVRAVLVVELLELFEVLVQGGDRRGGWLSA